MQKRGKNCSKLWVVTKIRRDLFKEKLSLTSSQLENLINELSKRNKLYWLNLMWKMPLSVKTCRNLPLYNLLSEMIHLLKPKFNRIMQIWLALYFTTLFSDGFESDFTAWSSTGGTPTIVEDPVNEGDYAARFDRIAPEEAGSEYAKKVLSSTYSELYARAYINIDAVGDYNRGYLTIHDEYSNYIAQIGADGSRYVTLRYISNGSTLEDKSATQYDLDTQHCIELYVKQDNVDQGEVRVWLDDVELDDLHQTGLDNYIAKELKEVSVGLSYGSVGSRVYVDSVVVADAYIGCEAVGVLGNISSVFSKMEVMGMV